MTQHVSSLGGPRILLPAAETDRWFRELGPSPAPDSGLYGLVCSVDRYCGVVAPWDVPLLVFGDDPADLYHLPDSHDGLFVRWIGANSLEELMEFAVAMSQEEAWDEETPFIVSDAAMTVLDACGVPGTRASRMDLSMQTGQYMIRSRYAESSGVMAIVHRFDRLAP